MTNRFLGSAFTRALRRIGLVRLSELEQARRSAAARTRAAQRERAAHERRAAAGKLHTAEAKLRSIKAELQAIRARWSAERNKRESYRERITELTLRAAALDAALDDARLTARRLKRTAASPRERLSALLPVRAAAIAATPGDPVREATFQRVAPSYADASSQWRAGHIPGGARAVTVGGLKWSIPADAGGVGSLSHRIVQRGWLPFEDIAFVRQFVVGGVMIDIGANIGTTSITRVVLGDFACAFCAEPNSDNYACLVGNVLDNGLAGRVLPDRVALSNSSGETRLRRATTIGGHKLMAPGEQFPSDTVTCHTMDGWIERLQIPAAEVAFVKVDTQGWDLHVLEGASGLLGLRRSVWQIEVSPTMLQSAGRSVEDLCAFVQTHFSDVAVVSRDSRLTPASEVGTLLTSELTGRRFTNLLLLNT